MSQTTSNPAEESARVCRPLPTAKRQDTNRTPPRVPLAFRVGVVGHRPNRLDQADLVQLAAVLRSMLSTIRDEVLSVKQNGPLLYASAAPVLRAISPLAEGTDRVFAEQGLALGFELCCVLPFSQAEFEKDFAPGKALEANSLGEFRHLLARAAIRFELDGCRADERGAYSAGGRVVLNQSDLLIVVWDGRSLGKRGGTEETFAEARRCGVPVAWVDAHAPHRWQLLDAASPWPQLSDGQRLAPDGSASHEALRKCVREALELPKPTENTLKDPYTKPQAGDDNPERNLERFYEERQPRWTLAVLWTLFRDMIEDNKEPKVVFEVTPFEEAVKKEWPEDTSSPVGRSVNWLRPFYAWPDKLAVLYSDRYRSAFIAAFLLAAAAVGMALLPFGANLHHGAETICIVCELAAIFLILGLVFAGRRCRWHERWIDYRLTAELVRHLRLVAPLGGGRPFPQVPAHWATYGQPGASWMAWYVRAVERVMGLPSAVVDKGHLDACLLHLTDLIAGQIRFHENTASRCHRLEDQLHRWGIGLLVLTLLSCAVHLVPGLPTRLPPLLTFFCGFFPALGAALAGIINQGEFRRINRRSCAMREQLELLRHQIESLRESIATAPQPPRQQYSTQAVALASDAARLLVNEVLDWRVVFLDRPLHPPT